ncbi:MAG: hypothetical protein F6K31_00025 [Symploca sp. SIO2G7]|nr:hypothetical protein [Symploca sp. SIO2G7]
MSGVREFSTRDTRKLYLLAQEPCTIVGEHLVKSIMFGVIFTGSKAAPKLPESLMQQATHYSSLSRNKATGNRQQATGKRI